VFSIPRDSSHIALDVGEQLTLEQALYAMLVESANDAANGIAEHIGGSIDKFVEMMNAKAQKLGAVNTHFANPHGLHSENHYTTAYDMAIITRAALNNEMFSKIAGTVKYTIPPTNKQPQERYLNNRNYLLNPSYKYDGAYCGKNGWTMQAKYTLVTCARKNERNLIAVVMKANTSDNSFFDSIRLFDYGFDQFKTVTIPKEKISVPAFNVTDSSNRIYQVNAFSDNNFTFLVYNAFNAENISVEIEYPPQKTLEALNDLKARFTVSADNKYMYSVLGEYKLTANAEKISEISVSDNNSNINKQNKLKQAIVLIFKILLYLFIFIIIIFIILLIIRYINLSRRKRRRRR